ncbi:hypothetical protein [Hungatella hathewayi]|nr:hypothetical protein [Hungatella hathewayi]MBS4984300.1 hypothetical protein [Hungatella hathewayi]
MQLKNLGISLGAIEKLGVIITQITNYDNIPNNVMEDLKDVTSGYSKEVILAAINQKVFTAEQAKTILTARGLEDAEIKQRIEMAELTATEGTNISVTQKLSLAWQGLAAKLGVSVGFLNVAAAGIAALAAGVIVYKQYQQAQEESRQAAQEAANTYMDSITTIENYTAKYEELHTALLKAKGNEEETYNVKKQLLDLQTKLNDKFGDEYGRLNLVTDAYKNHADAIKAYNQNVAKTFLNDISRSDQNKSVDMMTKQKMYNLSIGDVSGFSEESLELQDLIKSYEDKGMTTQISSDGMLWIYLNADPTNAEQTIDDFMTDVRNLAKKLGNEHIFDDLLDTSISAKDDAKEIISNWGDIYEKTLLGEIAYDNSLSNGMEEATQAVETYNEALLKSTDPYNDANVQKAYNNLQTVKSNIQDSGEEWDRYSSILNKVWDSANTKMYDLNEAVHSNQNGIGKFVEKLKDVDDIDLKTKIADESDNNYIELKKYAEEYGMSVNDLIDGLTELGYVQTHATEESESHAKSFSELFSSLPTDKIEEYMALIQNGTINEKTISSYSELSELMNQTGLSAEELFNKINEFTFDSIHASITELSGALEKTRNGELFSSEEIATLIGHHTDLATSITKTADGYAIESSAIESLISAYGDNERAMVLYQMHNTQSAIDGTKTRIEQYKTELKILLEMAGAVSGVDSWGEMLGTVNGSEQAAYTKYGKEAVDKAKELSAAQTRYSVQEKKLQKFSEQLDRIPTFPQKSPGAKSTPQEEQPKEFDWIKIRNENLKKEHDNFEKIFNDETKSYEEQLDAIDNLIAKDEERLKFSTDALSTYQKKWAEASAKLKEEDITNIKNGNDYVGEYTGQYAKDLQEAADIYKEITSFEEEIANLDQEQNDHIRKQVELRGKIIDAQQDEIKGRMALLQSRIDLVEAQGGVVSERMIQSQIRLSENLMRSYTDKIDNLYDQMEHVDPDSAAYSTLLAQINDCEGAIIDCKIQQQEWNEKIMRLPIERIQKYLNMLANIKQDLQNFLDEQSAMGINPTADQLQQLFDISKEEIKSLLEQQEKLKGLLEQYRFGSEKFNDVSQELQDIDNTISGLIQSQKEWNASILQIPVDQMGKLNDTLNLVSGTLDNVLSDYDSALSAITGVIDRQTESLEDLKSAAEESYQSKIDPLQQELDLLQKQNEERQTQLDLEQRQYDLDRARNQKSNKVIRNGEMVYEADSDAIRDASQGLADAQYNKLVQDLGNQITALEEERDKLLESYDTQIEKLGEIKDKWSSIVDEIQLAADVSKADNLLGQGWQDKILSGNDDDIYKLFKGLYENTSSQKSQLEEQTASNERIAEMMNQFVTRYQEGSISYEQAMAGIRELSEQMKDGYSSLEQLNALLGLNGVDNLESLLQNMQTSANASVNQFSDYMEIVKANADAMNQYTSSWEEMQQNIKDQIAALKRLAEEAAKAAEVVKTYVSNDRNDSSSGSRGPNVNDNHYVSSGPGHTAEALADAIAGRKEILEYHSGGLVGAKETPSRYIGLLSSKNLSKDEVYGKLLKREWVLTEEQQRILDANVQSILKASSVPMLNTGSNLSYLAEKSSPSINITMGDTILENVSRPDEFARALATQFRPLLRQEMSKL